jgi:signal transduction histidine kinase
VRAIHVANLSTAGPARDAPRRTATHRDAAARRTDGRAPLSATLLGFDAQQPEASMQNKLNLAWIVAPSAGVATAVTLLLNERGAAGSWLPHGYCFTWNPPLLWTHVLSDGLIGASYVSIPVTLLHLVRRRADIPFNWMLLLFAVFIVSCGATHWIEVWTVWHPDYWLAANVKLVTATASVLTAVALVRLVPDVLAVPTTAQLTAAKSALEAEVGRRARVEDELRTERLGLERRVAARTSELARATATAEAAHAAAEEANRLKDRFLAKVSHELRTPLQSTLSWARVLSQSQADPARMAQAAERIEHNVRLQARLIDDLLDVSRILSGRLRLEYGRVDVDAVIARAVEVAKASWARSGISVETIDESVDPRPLSTDAARLEQIVCNLVNNAAQASRPGGSVRVRFKVDANGLDLEVRDWGHGIDPADLDRLFEPFQQGSTNPNAHRGLGLGLAITRGIVTLFGGRIEAASDGIDRGASFRVHLPAEGPLAASDGTGASPLDEPEREALARMRVVYVDDDVDIAQAGHLMLSALGPQVESFTTFDTAKTRIEQGGFDVLLTDLALDEGHHARELLAALRATPQMAHVPAVVLSAYGGASERTASAQAGFAVHLVKPLDGLQIAQALLAAVRVP